MRTLLNWYRTGTDVEAHLPELAMPCVLHWDLNHFVVLKEVTRGMAVIQVAETLELRQTLARALELGGSTLRDFTDVHGMSGGYQAQAGVYGREGQPCGRCGAAVRRVVQGQRSTYFCVSCQRR